MSGSLVLVATPIGNLGDMSLRAIETLRTADVIACEDTRHTRKLLTHNDITGVKLIALHEHNEYEIASEIVERVTNGETVALVSDAGMPTISDPGERVVAAVAEAGLHVTVIPGASAALAALAVSGLPTDRFVFEGFLPRKASDRKTRLDELTTEQRTMIFYESPHRLQATAESLREAFGDDRRVAMVRELTKIHEEVRRTTLEELAKSADVKGECVLVVEGARSSKVEVTDDEISLLLQEKLAAGVSKRDAAAEVAKKLGVPRKRAYQLAIEHS